MPRRSNGAASALAAPAAVAALALALLGAGPCGAQQVMQGYSPVFRYDDDFSFLADPARRTDPVDAFKYVPLRIAPNAFVTFGLDDRERVEGSADTLLGFGYKRAQAYDLHRLLLDADMHVDDARIFVQLGSELETGRRPRPIPLDVDRLDLQQGFADYRLGAGSGALVLRAGRQEMSYDEGAIIGLRDGPNVRLSLDGVRTSYVDPTYTIDAFAVRPVNVSPGAFDDGELAGQALYGVHATVTPKTSPAIAVDGFIYFNTMPAVSFYPTTASEQTATFGTRLRLSTGGFDGSVGAIGQTGSYGGRNVLAYAVHVNGGYTFNDLPGAPGFTLRADVLSGSDDPGHGTVHTFNALYPNVAYSTEATIEAPANLVEPALLVFANPMPNLRVQYLVEDLLRYSTADAFYAAPLIPLVPGNSSRARFIGLEQQLSATLRLAARLEGLAEPGGICLSRGLHEQVTNKMSLVFRDIGPQSVKNIPTPIHAYVIAAASSQVGEAGGQTKVGARGRKLLPVLAGASAIVVAIGLSLFATGTKHADRPAASPTLGAQSVAPLPPPGVPAPTQATAIDVPPVDLMAAAETDAEACDRLAMAPFDGRGGRQTSGVEVAIIDPSESVPVCRKALDGNPNDARLAMELARSLDKRERVGNASSTF